MPAPRAARDNAGVSSILPINLDDLLRCRGVESARVEFKSGWNPQTTGYQALKTICAFANDYHNLNGGYVVLGVAEEQSRGNALYHRGYQAEASEPTKVYCYPDRIDITSYPGPVPGIEPDHFLPAAAVPAMPARNRRIGEFFSKLKLAERRLTGVPKIFEAMARNGSPPPRFDFDEGRTWFRATLPVHPGESGTS